jgi:hypothetical protein
MPRRTKAKAKRPTKASRRQEEGREDAPRSLCSCCELMQTQEEAVALRLKKLHRVLRKEQVRLDAMAPLPAGASEKAVRMSFRRGLRGVSGGSLSGPDALRLMVGSSVLQAMRAIHTRAIGDKCAEVGCVLPTPSSDDDDDDDQSYHACDVQPVLVLTAPESVLLRSCRLTLLARFAPLAFAREDIDPVDASPSDVSAFIMRPEMAERRARLVMAFRETLSVARMCRSGGPELACIPSLMREIFGDDDDDGYGYDAGGEVDRDDESEDEEGGGDEDAAEEGWTQRRACDCGDASLASMREEMDVRGLPCFTCSDGFDSPLGRIVSSPAASSPSPSRVASKLPPLLGGMLRPCDMREADEARSPASRRLCLRDMLPSDSQAITVICALHEDPLFHRTHHMGVPPDVWVEVLSHQIQLLCDEVELSPPPSPPIRARPASEYRRAPSSPPAKKKSR